MTEVTLQWDEKKLTRAINAAQRDAINETTERIADGARDLAPREEGDLQDGIGFKKARTRRGVTTGHVTSAGAPHVYLVEAGAHGQPGVHMFRRAADREFPLLRLRLVGAYNKRTRKLRPR